MAELARAEVALEVSFEHLEEDIKRGLEQRVRAAAKKAQAELDATEVAAAALGDTIDKQVGGKAEAAAQKVRQAARKVQKDLSAAGEAAKATGTALEDAGDATKSIRTGTARTVAEMVRLETAARKAAAAAQTARKALDEPQGALFDIDTGKVVEVQRDLKGVQDALFDLDTVELDKIEKASDRAAKSLRSRLASAAERARVAIEGFGRRGGAAGLDDLGQGVEDLGRRTDRAGLSLDKFSGRLTVMVSAIAAAATLAPVAAAAGAGLGAALAVSIPTIARVIKSQEEMADLWDSLSRDERIASVATRNLVDEYKALSAELAPDALRTYNGVISETARLLPRLEPLARTTFQALSDSVIDLGNGLDSPRATKFFRDMEEQAGPALESVTDLLMDTGAAAASLVTALGPLVPVGLGTVGMLLRLVTALNDISPGLTQAAVLAVALRGPVGAIGGLLSKSVKGVKEFSAATKGASLGTKLLNAATSAGPNIYLAAGAALAVFALSMAQAETSAERATKAINANARAVGNNLDGYTRANQILRRQYQPSVDAVAAATERLQSATTANNVAILQGAQANQRVNDTFRATGDAIAANDRAYANVTAAAQLLAREYGITEKAAIQLANAAGVNLSKGVVESGSLIASAADKIGRYRDAADVAKSSTQVLDELFSAMGNTALGTADRVEALNGALNRLANPAVAFAEAGVRMRAAEKELDKALRQTNLSADKRQEKATTLARSLLAYAEGEFAATQSTKRSEKAYRNNRDELEKALRKTKEGPELLAALEETFGRMADAGNDAAGGMNAAKNAADDLIPAGLDAAGALSETAAQAGSLFNNASSAAGPVANLAGVADKVGKNGLNAATGLSNAAAQAGNVAGSASAASGPMGTLATNAGRAGTEGLAAAGGLSEAAEKAADLSGKAGEAAGRAAGLAAASGRVGAGGFSAAAGMAEAAAMAGDLSGTASTAASTVGTLAETAQGAGGKAATAAGQVGSLGRQINNLPKSKRINITANTAPARGALGELLATINSSTAAVKIGAVGNVNLRSLPAFGRARGGSVRGPGTGTSDSIPAWLSDGEYVVNARQTRRWLPLLEMINAGKFAAGGLVGAMRRLTSGALAVQPAQGYASGGTVTRAPLVDIGALLGADIRRGLRGSSRAINAEVERIRKSLEKKILAIGEAVGKDFITSIATGSASQIDSAFRSLEKKITTAFRGIRTTVDDRLVARLDAQNKRLSDLAKRRDTIAKQIEEATQLAADVTSRAQDFANITRFDDAQQASARTITDTLRTRLTAIRDFQKNIQNLTKRGLDKGVIRELLEAGVDEGGQLARLLANSSQGDLAQISSLQRQIDKATKNLGTQSADLLFDAGKAAGKGFLAGLKAEQAEIVKLMADIAKSVSQTVKKTLKIKSPSRVLEQDGINTMAGYIRGVQRLARRARSAVAAGVQPSFDQLRAAAPTRVAAGAGMPVQGTARGTRQAVVHQTNHFHQVAVDVDSLLARSEQRLVAALR